MRVIAGSLKGRQLKAPKWEGLRPTSDKLRETLFNILAPRIRNARMLDGYAGTGAIGIEGMSRGAREVVFVEQNGQAQALIAENLAACGITKGYTIVGTDIRRATRDLWRRAPGMFEIAFLDPPYSIENAELEQVLDALSHHVLPNGVAVLEHARRKPAPDAVGRLARARVVPSGDSELSFYEVVR
jgi:16S rRNA (guanine966-N2)-methyltransferase